VTLDARATSLPIGKAELLRDGSDIVIAAIGHTVVPALKAAQELAPLGINAAVVNARFVKPLDRELFGDLLRRVPNLITVEDHVTTGGFGSALIEFLADEGINGVEIRRLGVPDRFIPHGTQDELRKLCGFDKDAIAQAVLQMVRRGKKKSREGWERGSA
jgi:1-deoxy-D-xylulose-5-phosphate synthase